MSKKKRCAIKDEELEKEICEFKKWLSKQHNKTLQRKFRTKKQLKPGYQKWIIKKVKTICRTHIGKLPSQLTKADIKNWEDFSYSNYDNNGNISRFQAMNKLLEFLGHSEWMLILPSPVEKRYPVLTEKERERYINTVQNSCKGILNKKFHELKPKDITRIMDRAIVLMQALLVCRPSELCTIKMENIDFERNKIILEDSKTHELLIRKNMEDVLTLVPVVTDALKDWLKIRNHFKANNPEENKYLFIHGAGKYKGRRIGYNKIRIVCKEFGVKANISISTTPYTLKRTEITRDCDNNNNIGIPQARARHTSFKTTLRYNHKNTNDVNEYIKSEKYNDSTITQRQKIQDGIKEIAQRVATGEIPIETYNQLRADLQLDTNNKKRDDPLTGYL